MSTKITRYVVFSVRTKTVVSSLFRNRDDAILTQLQLNDTVGFQQYAVGSIQYEADPLRPRYIIAQTTPENLRTPLTPPPARRKQTHNTKPGEQK